MKGRYNFRGPAGIISNALSEKTTAVRHDVALADVPVGFLCSAIRGLGLTKDIGTAGFDGFTGVSRGAVDQVRYFNGGTESPWKIG